MSFQYDSNIHLGSPVFQIVMSLDCSVRQADESFDDYD